MTLHAQTKKAILSMLKHQSLNDRLWTQETEIVEGLPRGMLGKTEAAMLRYIAREYYGGFGDIIDAGAFLGSSSYCFADGLRRNSIVKSKANRIHAFDLFEVWKEPGGSDEEMASLIRRDFGIEISGYESTLGIYTSNLGDLARYVTAHQGDILKKTWSGRPIEILFIDICKTLPVWKHVVATFYPSLIPGISLVLHQDWHHPWLPYLHVGQEYMSDYFDVFERKANDTAGWIIKNRIPDRVIDRVANFDFSLDEQINLIDRSIKRFEGQSRFIKLAKAVIFLNNGDFNQASKIVNEVALNHGEHISANEQEYFSAFAGGVAVAAERVGFSAFADFNEDQYLIKNPDVAQMVRNGIFDTGLRHWFRHGRWEGRPV